jgi:hypothetical protein
LRVAVLTTDKRDLEIYLATLCKIQYSPAARAVGRLVTPG